MPRAFESETKRMTDNQGNNGLPIAFFGFLCLCFAGIEIRLGSATLSTYCFAMVGVISCIVAIVIGSNERSRNGSIAALFISVSTLLAIGLPILLELFLAYFKRSPF